MKKIDLGQLLAISANAGVLVGILLLVFELRQNNENMEIQTSLAIVQLDNELDEMPLVHPEILTAIGKSLSGEELTELEDLALSAFVARSMKNLEWRYLNSPESAIRHTSTWRSPPSWGLERWKSLRATLDPAFVEWAENEIWVD